MCGQLEVSKFWSVLTKKNKLKELQINTHVGDFPYILIVSSVFFFSYSNYTQNDIALLFKLLLLKKERPPLPKNLAKAFI